MKTRAKSPRSVKKIVTGNDTKAKNNIVLNVASAFGSHLLKGKSINFKVLIKCTNETFNVAKFPITMQIRDLKSCLEFICGIPFNLQRLSYLDDGKLKF